MITFWIFHKNFLKLMDNICLKNIQLGIIPTKNIRLCRTQLHHRLSPKKERFLVPSILIILSYYYIICWNSGPQRHVSHLEIYHIIYMAVPSGTCDDKIKGGWIYIQWIPYRSLLSTNKHNVKKKKKTIWLSQEMNPKYVCVWKAFY